MSEVKSTKPTTKASVLVGCRFRAGIVLRTYNMIEQREVLPGGREQTVKVAQPTGEQFRLAGTSDPKQVVAQDLTGEYAVTQLPREFWERWLHDHKDTDLVKNKIVFAADSQADLDAIADDFKKDKTGLEPVDPAKPHEKMGRSRMRVEPGKAAA